MFKEALDITWKNAMIKKTRLKIVLVVEVIIASIFIVVASSLLLTSYYKVNNDTKNYLTRTVKMIFDDRQNPPLRSREFSIVITDKIVMEYDNKFYSEEEVVTYMNTICQSKSSFGNINKITYMKQTIGNKTIIVAVDVSIEKGIIQQTLLYIVIFGFIGLAVLGCVMWFLTKWIMEPIRKNIESQKVFISNASHELKTPITSVIANISILEEEYGKNQWTKNITNQAVRLSALSDELLTLSKLDENSEVVKENINLSALLNETLLSLESIAYENNKEIKFEIEEDIYVVANRIELNRVIDICVDNAIKHSIENEAIVIKLGNKSKPILSIFNKTNHISKSEEHKLFDRFYRGDNSRSRETGGSGLGLSIVKKTAENNKWEIMLKIVENESLELIIKFGSFQDKCW